MALASYPDVDVQASARKSSIFKRIDAYAHPSPEGEAAEPPAGSPLLTTPALRAATVSQWLSESVSLSLCLTIKPFPQPQMHRRLQYCHLLITAAL